MNLSRRQICDRLKNESLLELAKRIASFSEKEAREHGLMSALPEPYNVLANAVDGRDWRIPHPISEVQEWKNHRNGFSGEKVGLSVRFDPFVDAALYCHFGRQGQRINPTVLVLTDYGPWESIVEEADSSGGSSDWALKQINEFLEGRALDTTGNNIVKAVTKKSNIEAVQRDFGCIEKAFGEHGLFLWNYFPFARGGKNAEGKEGLPAMGRGADLQWVTICERFLADFCKAVGAKKVAIAINQDVGRARKGRLLPLGIDVQTFEHPRSWGCTEKKRHNTENFRTFLCKK